MRFNKSLFIIFVLKLLIRIEKRILVLIIFVSQLQLLLYKLFDN